MPVIFWRCSDSQRFFAARRGGDLVALLGEELPERVADRVFVVHDEQRDGPSVRGTDSSTGLALARE